MSIDNEQLKLFPLFKNLPDASLRELASMIHSNHYNKEETIIRQDEPGDSMFLIQEGKVKVVLFGEDGKEVILSSMKEGDFFGEMSLLDGQPRSATVIATESTHLFVLRREAMLALMRDQPELGLVILSEMSSRLRLADQNIKSLALLDVYGRVARELRMLSREEGIQAGTNIVVENRPTHQDIAAKAGTSRETVSRIIGDLIRAGFISMDGRRLIIHNEFLDEEVDMD